MPLEDKSDEGNDSPSEVGSHDYQKSGIGNT